MRFCLGIDASNLRVGGGVTHLSELVKACDPSFYGIDKIVLWGGRATLDRLPDRTCVLKVHVPTLDRSLPFRFAWQQLRLPQALRISGCNVLFAPGGTLPNRLPVPAVTMSQNLLPFEAKEAARFGTFSLMRLKMTLLHQLQRQSMARAAGLIFLSRYAREIVVPQIERQPTQIVTIPHGVGRQFYVSPRIGEPLSNYSLQRPFRLLYVSTIDVYKHQWHVANAVATLRRQGIPVSIDFVGSAHPTALARLVRVIKSLDPQREFLHYRGACDFDTLPDVYRRADGFIFASSCENLPNILLEAMVAGLPIVCSNLGPMPEVLGSAGLYFHPERPTELASSLRLFLEQSALRDRLARSATARGKQYSWERCAAETFSFIANVWKNSLQTSSEA